MKDPEFDAFIDSYERDHQRSISFSGCDTAYFARYKVDIAARCFRELCGTTEPLLDFGCGPGTSLPLFREALPDARLLAADVSGRSLEEARSRHGDKAEYLLIRGARLDLSDGEVGMAFAACVFHHIPPEQHGQWMRELYRVVKPGGGLVIFEHNPLNPLTRHAVSRCAFDKDAILLGAQTLKQRLERSGWRVLRTRFHVFFPQILQSLRWLEPSLGLLPLGGQYSVLSVKT